mgnify:CR=1 FL=1
MLERSAFDPKRTRMCRRLPRTSGDQVRPDGGRIFPLLTIVVSWPVAALCAQPCGDAPDHASERACWIKAAKDSDARVHMEQELQRQRIDQWDQDRPYRARTLALFNEAADKFAHLRHAQCDYEASAAAGGNGAGDMRLSCQGALDNAYLKSLRSQVASFPPRG